MQFVPYLSFNGDCETAFRRYAEVLGGELVAVMRYGEAPPEAGIPAESANQIMHAQLAFGDQSLMGADCAFGHAPQAGSMRINLMIAEPAEAERVFAALMEGGAVEMPMAETFWATRFGMGTDRFGTPWMVNCMKECGTDG